jgi:hypothetical protein
VGVAEVNCSMVRSAAPHMLGVVVAFGPRSCSVSQYVPVLLIYYGVAVYANFNG